MILSCQNISKAFIVNELLQNINIIINAGEKVALIGVNGAGKTTLFRIITGELLPDDGQVIIATGKTLGYLKQNALSESDFSLYEEVYRSNDQLIHLQAELESLEEKYICTKAIKTIFSN
jgi:ATP-binding cassette subfamily F protein 3